MFVLTASLPLEQIKLVVSSQLSHTVLTRGKHPGSLNIKVHGSILPETNLVSQLS